MSRDEGASVFEVRNVSKEFGHRRGLLRGKSTFVQALEDVSLEITRGETLGLVGESGSGKSTLGRLLLAFDSPSQGEILFEGRKIEGLSRSEERAFRGRVQMVFQNTFASLNPRRTMEDSLSAGMKVHEQLTGAEISERLSALLQRVGLHESMLARYPHQFSGGQRQRMVIARALSVDPDVIIADEAVSALDVSVQAQVLNLLKGLQKEMDLTTVFIAHDLRVVNFVSDRIGVMYLGRLVELGSRSDVVGRSLHPYTRMLLATAPGASERRQESQYTVRGEIGTGISDEDRLRAGCVFSPRCWLRERLGQPTRCTDEVPTLRWVKDAGGADGQYAACHYAEEILSGPSETDPASRTASL